jgi:hypothetical protein
MLQQQPKKLKCNNKEHIWMMSNNRSAWVMNNITKTFEYKAIKVINNQTKKKTTMTKIPKWYWIVVATHAWWTTTKALEWQSTNNQNDEYKLCNWRTCNNQNAWVMSNNQFKWWITKTYSRALNNNEWLCIRTANKQLKMNSNNF